MFVLLYLLFYFVCFVLSFMFLPRFAVFVDGDDNGVFPFRGNCAPIPASLDEIQQDLQKRLGGLFQHPIRDGVHTGGD